MAKDSNWNEIKAILSRCSGRDLLGLIKELYSLNQDNKMFLNTRFVKNNPDILDDYKALISDYVCPYPPTKKIKLGEARKIINRYKKATGDMIGILDLSMHYVEQGVENIKLYGDMYESFYYSMETMFKDTLALLSELIKAGNNDLEMPYITRIKKVIHIASRTGWGFEDQLLNYMAAFFPKINLS